MTSNSARDQQFIDETFRAPLRAAIATRYADVPAFLDQFVEHFWRRIARDEVAYFDLEHAVGATLSCWHLLDSAGPRPQILRIHNPSFARDGWETIHTVVQLLHPDMPFLTDSLLMQLARDNLTVHHLQNLALHVNRDIAGRVLSLESAGAPIETLIYIETDRIEDRQCAALTARLLDVLAEVRAAVGDYAAMKQRAYQLVGDLCARAARSSAEQSIAQQEAAQFLQWLSDDHFTFLGFRSFVIDAQEIRQEAGTALGVFTRRVPASAKRLEKLLPETRGFLLEAVPLSFSKSGTRSRVHRPAYPDYVTVKEMDERGQVVREHDFLGLYTSTVYAERPTNIPIVRRKIANVLARSELNVNAFDGKNLVTALAAYPRDELFQCSEDELFDNAMGIVRIHERRRVKLFLRRDRYGLFYSCLVFVPRDRFNTQLRKAMQAVLTNALAALDVAFESMFSESVLVRTQFVLRVDPNVHTQIDVDDLEQQLVAVTRDWGEDFQSALVAEFGEQQARDHAQQFLNAFPTSYREQFTHRAAAYDVRNITRLSATNDLVMRLYREPADDAARVHLKLYHFGEPLPLSDVLPKLENLGLRVLDEHPYRLAPTDGADLSIQELVLDYPAPLDLHQIGDLFEDAFVRIWNKDIDDDRYNRLILAAGLDYRGASLLRAYGRYLKQIHFGLGQEFIADTLVRHATVTRALIDYFYRRFDPRADAAQRSGREQLLRALDDVQLLNEDRVLRRYLQLMDATLRTNFFQVDDDGKAKPYIALKFDCAALTEMPKPVPAYEVFVYSRRSEGVHLRNGRIARGGLRWSDRLEDYRAEVLGLVKAQVVKNAVIVPTGAKGGFVVKHPPVHATQDDRDALQNEAIACYRIFISGLLDITDNYAGERVVTPPNVRHYDDSDPYLVVAADKGTATFSDIANEIATARHFWLGDAFASGGSHGYDHKELAITARGAWIAVERHFRERGVDANRDAITVVGIGDMSGDVFGNGLLRSRSVKLLAAFNHLHIFIDPDPDPEQSFRERQRLFDMPRSSWNDYDAALLSPGGGVYSRQQKAIKLSSAACERLHIDVEALTPDQLIHQLLKAPVDLLWNGGIGTYAKASHESHANVGDRANDALRVDGNTLRCKVFAEGGNLGLTQAARVEFSLGGGSCNTDFIDNSAGVDCSDHEVNIKIALDLLTDAGEMTTQQRNALLAEASDEVAELVLTNNFRQAQALTLSERHAATRLAEYARLIQRLELEQQLDRDLEGLPSDASLTERYEQGHRLTRPELAVLLCHAKIHLKERLLGTRIGADTEIAGLLLSAFPAKVVARCGAWLMQHRLADEIICTQVANDVVHHMGPSFLSHLKEFVGGDYGDIVRAYFVAAGVFEIRVLFRSVERADMGEAARLVILLELIRLCRRGTRWWLRHFRGRLDVAQLRGRFGEIARAIAHQPEIVEPARLERLRQMGVDEPLARELAGTEGAVDALPIIELCASTHVAPATVAPLYARVGELLETDWLVNQLAELPPKSHWQAMERDAIVDELLTHQGQICARIVHLNDAGTDDGDGGDMGKAMQRFERDCSVFINAWRQVINDARKIGVSDYALFSMSARKLNELLRML